MNGDLQISVDKLPIKRLEFIEEQGAERFPSDIGYDEKTVNLIRRIDFAWAVEREEPSKKQKKNSSSTSSKETSNDQPWKWQSLVENLRLAHQELQVIIDLIHTVETNDAVTVAGMTRPKQLPNEHLSDLAVSMATKLQCFRHLGKYFKQSAKALEQQVAREARFYGALIRLQQNWKVKWHRMVAAASGNEGFYIDLFDTSLYDPAVAFRPSSASVVRIEHDPAGMLAVNVPPNSCRTLQFDFFGASAPSGIIKHSRTKPKGSFEDSSGETKKEKGDDEHVRETHSTLREVHRAIFDEQVFDLVNREAFNPALGADVTGLQENLLRLSIGQRASLSISLVPSTEDDQTASAVDDEHSETAIVSFESIDASKPDEGKLDFKKLGFPNRISFEIYLQQLFHEHVFIKAKKRLSSLGKPQISAQPMKDGPNLLGHFCVSLAHRIFSNKVLAELESLVSRIPYVQLISHPTWHSRTSSWTISMNVPESILHAGSLSHSSDYVKNVKSHFRTKVMVRDDCISLEGEGAPNVVGLFKGKPDSTCPMNRYDCDLSDLPMVLLQQVASQVIRWLHEEALMVGIKANRDFLSLSFELEQGETLSLVAHVDPEDIQGCISWWLVMDDGFSGESKLRMDVNNGESETRKFLGYLSLKVLYSTLMDMVSVSSTAGH
ncbi:mediator of RNA polymerase II transcription subunit 17 [Lycium barbarum]|uniref:mediator of RNA polymerase II transcription subunit 17 n=1 Tax=Lycium barbarum TaxID=112863 RepID=UPI00293E18B1|nr:mediator of RNA polymerase II transcription subunit 17 [Lycium barbarum]